MPIYEYECPKCGKFDVIQKISERPLKAKPDCNDSACPKKAKKLISAAAFHLKGSGWYKTDYGSSSSSGSSSSTGSSSGSDGESDSSKKKEKKEAPGSKSGEKSTTGAAKGSCGSGCGCS